MPQLLASAVLSAVLSVGMIPVTAAAAELVIDGAAPAVPEGALGEAPSVSQTDDEGFAAGIATMADATKTVNKPTQDQIRSYIISKKVNLAASAQYATEPLLEAPYAAGALAQGTLDNALNTLNMYRYIVGIPSNVTLDATYNQQCQAACVVSAGNGKLNHYPTQPAGMGKALYDLGYQGASSSNLSLGWVYGAGPADSVTMFMSDSDEANVGVLGHRWWCLNPTMQKTGFGYAGIYGAMYSMDTPFGANQYDAIAWPAANTPVELFDVTDAWSVSGPWIDASDSSISVTLVRARDGKTWNFSKTKTDDGFFAANVGFNGRSDRQTVIFRPDGVGSYNDGDSFNVTVKTSARTYSYAVNFFNVLKTDSISLMKWNGEQLQPTESSETMGADGEADLVAMLGCSANSDGTFDAFQAAGSMNVSVTWSSSDPSVVSVESWEVDYPGYVHLGTTGELVSTNQIASLFAYKAGTAVITATASNGLKASVTIEVGNLGSDSGWGEWKYDSNGWWFSMDDGSYPANEWAQIDGSWYHFNASGYMQTGWQYIGGAWYYLDGSGAMASNQWVGDYWLTGSGAMATNSWVDGGTYYVGSDGAWIPDYKA